MFYPLGEPRLPMDARVYILSELYTFRRREPWNDLAGFTWDDTVFLRTCLIHQERAVEAAWSDFIARLADGSPFGTATLSYLVDRGFIDFDMANLRLILGVFPPDTEPLSDYDAERFVGVLENARASRGSGDEKPSAGSDRRTRIMYIERASSTNHDDSARIGRVSFSKTGRTVYYRGKSLRKSAGVIGNHIDVDNGEEYWVSGPKKNGQDRHWAGKGVVNIDADVVDEYWREIRGCEPPENPLVT